MKQSATESLVLWSVLAIVFGVTYGIGTSAEVQTSDSQAQTVQPAMSYHGYPGPSNDYATVPYPESLTYRERGGDAN